MTEYETEPSQLTDFLIQIENCLLKALKSSESLMSQQLVQAMQQKVQDISNPQTAVESVEHFLFTFINTIETLKQEVQIHIDKADYENLEGAVQKAQAEIRKHIRLEQQLKIYMDGLEEKVEQLERELQVQSMKYHQLFDSMKSIDLERRELKKKISNFQEKSKGSADKQSRNFSHKTSKILTEPSSNENEIGPPGYAYRMYNQRSRATKTKNFIERYTNPKQESLVQDKSKKGLDSSSVNKGLDRDIEVSLRHSPSCKRPTQKSEIKQLTRTIQLKQNYRKQSRKLLKYGTDQKSGMMVKRDGRCNSVCH